MKYPFGFTEDLQRPVETARDRAELVWREAMSAKRGHPEALARDFVAQVFREFARQACEAERRGIWSAAESRKHVEWFLEWELIPHVYDVTDIRRFYRLVGGFQASVLQRMKDSDVWREYLEDRCAVAMDEDASDGARVAPVPTVGKKPNAFPKRAAWLEELMGMRELAAGSFESLHGPDSKTIEKIIAGQPVRDQVLHRLAKSLSHDNNWPSVSDKDIPPD